MKDILRQVATILRLYRWSNLIFCALIVVLMDRLVVLPILNQSGFANDVLPLWMLILLTLSVVGIAAGGYAINDYFDAKIDAINRPEQQIVTVSLSKPAAAWCHHIATGVGVAAGLVVAFFLRSWMLVIVVVFVPGLLWFYSSAYKRQLFIGNLIVALSSALAPLTVAIANVDHLHCIYDGRGIDFLSYSPVPKDIYLYVGFFALFAFLISWIREIIKDLQDEEGDREMECHTMPIKWGSMWTKIFLTFLFVLTMGALSWVYFYIVPCSHAWNTFTTRFLVFGMLVPLACNLWLVWAAQLPSDYKHAQLLTKFIMFLGLMAAFFVPSIYQFTI